MQAPSKLVGIFFGIGLLALAVLGGVAGWKLAAVGLTAWMMIIALIIFLSIGFPRDPRE